MGEIIKNKWDFLLQCRPEIRSMIGNSKLIRGHVSHSDNHEKIFHFITKKGTVAYDEKTDEFESKLQIR
jgi:hypothetical protein